MLEGINETLKTELLSILNSPSLNDDLVGKMIRSTYFYNKDEMDEMFEWGTKKGFNEVIVKYIISIIKEHGDYEPVMRIARNGGVLTIDDVTKNNNIYTLLEKEGMSRKVLQELSQATISSKSINVGIFEVLLNMVIKGDQGYGGVDIVREDGKIEVKGPHGRLHGQKHHEVTSIDKYILSKYSDIKLNKFGAFSGIKATKSLWNDIMKKTNNIDDTYKFILDAMCKQFETESCSFQLVPKIKDIIINNGKPDFIQLHRLFGCIQLYMYCMEEGFDYFIVFKGDTKDATKEGEYEVFEKSDLLDINTMFFNKNLIIDPQKWIRIGSSRDPYCGVVINL